VRVLGPLQCLNIRLGNWRPLDLEDDNSLFSILSLLEMVSDERKPSRAPHPPIVEAIVDIDCVLSPRSKLEDLEMSARDSLREKYPLLQRRFLQQFQIHHQGEVKSKNDIEEGSLDALLFRSADNLQLTQFRRTGFSFNRLAPYHGMNEYFPEIERTWNNYRLIADPLRIGRIGLRMINRIELPLDQSGIVELDSFFKTGPRLPVVEGRSLTFTGFLNQHQIFVKDSGDYADISLAIEGRSEEKISVILDINAFDKRSREELDWEEIEPVLQSLRSLKNQLFFNTLTEECLNLYTCQS